MTVECKYPLQIGKKWKCQNMCRFDMYKLEKECVCSTVVEKRLPFPSKKNVPFVPYNLGYIYYAMSDRNVVCRSVSFFLELRHFCILVRVN